MLLQGSEFMVFWGMKEAHVERTDSGRSRLLDACKERVGALMVLAIGEFPDTLLAQLNVREIEEEEEEEGGG